MCFRNVRTRDLPLFYQPSKSKTVAQLLDSLSCALPYIQIDLAVAEANVPYLHPLCAYLYIPCFVTHSFLFIKNCICKIRMQSVKLMYALAALLVC